MREKKLECGHLGPWYTKWTLYKKFLNWHKISKKIKWLLAKLRSLWYFHFVLTILFVLTLASDMAVVYGNDTFSILVLLTKKCYSSFLKKVFVLQKIYLKVKVLKTFKISTNCHIKTCRFFKQMAILKIPSIVF